MRKPKKLIFDKEEVKAIHTFCNSINGNLQTFYFSSDKGEFYFISDTFFSKLTSIMNMSKRMAVEINKTYGKEMKLCTTSDSLLESEELINEFYHEYTIGNTIKFGDTFISLDRNSVGLPIQMMRFNLTVIMYKRIFDKKYNLKSITKSLLLKKEKLDSLIEDTIKLLVDYEILIPEDKYEKYFIKPIRKVINTKGSKISKDIRLYKFMKYNERSQDKRRVLSEPDVYDFKKMREHCRSNVLYDKVLDGTCVFRYLTNNHFRRQSLQNLFILPRKVSNKYKEHALYKPTSEDYTLMREIGFSEDYIKRIEDQTKLLRL